jgi:hypothetical protein
VAVKVYPGSAAAPVSPSYSAGWNYTAAAARAYLRFDKGGAGLIASGTIGAWTPGQQALGRQWVSDAIAAQTLTGTVKMQMGMRQTATSSNARHLLSIYVVSNDGSTVRGTLLSIANYGNSNALSASGTGRNKTVADGDAVTSVAAQDGDRIVVEFGFTDASGTTPSASFTYGVSTSTTDLPIDESTAAGTGSLLNPWIEFSFDVYPWTALPVPSTLASSAGVVAGASLLGYVDASSALSSSAAVVAGASLLGYVEVPSELASSAAVVAGLDLLGLVEAPDELASSADVVDGLDLLGLVEVPDELASSADVVDGAELVPLRQLEDDLLDTGALSHGDLACRAVHAFLRDNFEDALREYETELELQAGVLPDPKRYHRGPARARQESPLVAVHDVSTSYRADPSIADSLVSVALLFSGDADTSKTDSYVRAYAAAFIRLIRSTPRLGTTDGAVVSCVLRSQTYQPDTEGQTSKIRVGAEFILEVITYLPLE